MSNNKTDDPRTPFRFPPPPPLPPLPNPKALMLDLAAPDVAVMTLRLLVLFFVFSGFVLVGVPWQQTSTGTGKVVAYSPNERIQKIYAPVSGRIKKWFVSEGSYLKAGDPIVELMDIDPKYLHRIKIEREAVLRQYEAAQTITKTARYDFDRETNLFEQGISSRKDMELATINFKNAQSGEAQALANLTQLESKLSRQQSQLVKAPMEGTISRLRTGTTSLVVGEGDYLAVFVPKAENLSVVVFIPGMDLPLMHKGRKVRLQFDGWPAVQFSGWPSVAVGTFGGEVVLVDQTVNEEGLFRVTIIPDGKLKWPDPRFIRQGTKVNAWILLNVVSVGYELWRNFNGFPPVLRDRPLEEEENNVDLGLEGIK